MNQPLRSVQKMIRSWFTWRRRQIIRRQCTGHQLWFEYLEDRLAPSISTQTAVTASAASSMYGQTVTFAAIVTASNATPTGDVEFFDDTTGTDLGQGVPQNTTLDSATWIYTTLPTQLQVTGSADTIRADFTGTNFTGSSATFFGGETVTPIALTVMDVSANNKVYDAGTAATLNTSAALLKGVLSGDTVTLNPSGASGTFASKNVGSNIPVTVSGVQLSGQQAADYTLIQPTLTANITPAPLTITAVANTKTYDATTNAAATPTVSGLQGSDTVTGLSEIYSDANASSGKTLSVYAPTMPISTLTGLAYPDALAFDGSGNLYVANYGANSVSEFAPGATTPSATLSGFDYPDALAFDGGGNLYVANENNNTVSKFAPSATKLSRTKF